MIQLLIRTLIFLGSAAIGLLAQSILSPFLTKVAMKNATAFLGGMGLVSAFVALLIANTFTDGLTITGASTWILASLIVWLVTAVSTMLLPFILIKAGVENARERRAA